ncbi:hypothetical protein COE26_27795 [Bacillus cereus]|uniref:ATP-dependent nuclease n=1 Tax=Bacillus cereus TaxID=1396 RepID=UPI000BFB3632|nr:AAA family ATPase [Bacillus cereus]PGW64693.1 hypothetical protein COE26_27795 [Bacillus cereus]
MRIQSFIIRNFRSIKEQSVENIENALLLVGKNNSGKSSILNAIRAFFGQYDIKEEDFHKDSNLIEISVDFTLNDEYINTFIFDTKIGGNKVPSNILEFDNLKVETEYSDNTFSQYKQIRQGIFVQTLEEIIQQHADALTLWKNSLKKRYGITDNICNLKLKINKENLNKEYFNTNDEVVKDVEKILPLLAFIDDDRNFSEEENGKSKTITADLFGNYIMKRTTDTIICQFCSDNGCDRCMEQILQKQVQDLEIEDLEKLLKRKVKKQSMDVSIKVSELFQKNYAGDYTVEFEPKSDVNKSLSISTKVYASNINRVIDLANVGAGVRSIYILSLLQAYHEISNKNNIIFIIEEPEIYLHPSLQKKMSSILMEISRQTQIIFTTHSPLMLKNFELEQVRKVFMNESYETNVLNTTLPELFSELGYSTEDVIGTDFVIFLEGKDDKKRLEYLINKFYEIDLSKVLLIDTKSCHNIEIYATLRFLNKTTLGDNFLIIRDSDTSDPNELVRKLINKFRENLGDQYPQNLDEKVLITKYSSFDNYFLNPSILCQLRIIKNEEQFYNKIQEFLTQKREEVIEYLYAKNSPERALLLESTLYREAPIMAKIDDIKHFVRGHDLFGIFGGLKRRINEYVEYSSENDFEEILNHLDKIPYFKINRKRYVAVED